MAAYQGERFVVAQLQSILAQLSVDDEIIIVDDASTDGTRAQISSLRDHRVTLLGNDRNNGVLRSFERSLARATGEIIFLSDQDDIWLPGKVEKFLSVFSGDPQLMLVASDATLVDEDGLSIGPSFYEKRGKFRSGLWSNVLIGKFHGCTMAFRSALQRKVLPFPPGTQTHHDTWIGCVNAMTGGKTGFINEPLVAYRRHSANVTGRYRFSNYVRLKTRAQLLFGLALFQIRRLAH